MSLAFSAIVCLIVLNVVALVVFCKIPRNTRRDLKPPITLPKTGSANPSAEAKAPKTIINLKTHGLVSFNFNMKSKTI